jgi:hypothetical protein
MWFASDARSRQRNESGARLIFCDEGPRANCALVRRLLELNVVGPQTMLSFTVCASFCVECVAGDLRTIDDAAHFTTAPALCALCALLPAL